ncbi:MAG: hypothetical protein Q4E74_09690 [Ruminococcus sp.]|nr:hypothetical protein [Ruminococcus sp.]
MINRLMSKYNSPTKDYRYCAHCSRSFSMEDDSRSKYCKRCRLFFKQDNTRPKCKRHKQCKYGVQLDCRYGYACGYMYYTGEKRSCSAENCDKFERR